MAVDRTRNLNHQTRYELSHDGGLAAPPPSAGWR
jgi:hypothetical protein